MHLSDEHVERLLHGELSPSSATSAREHLSVCRACHIRVDEATVDERRTYALLAELDHQVPHVDVHSVIARAQPRRAGWYRWAAGALVAVSAAGAAYAAPGSPVEAWLRSLWERFPVPAVSPVPVTPPAAAVAPNAGMALGGLAVAPGTGLVIDFRNERSGSVLRVTRTDGPVVLIQGPAAAASFTSAAGRVVIDNLTTDPVTFHLQIPRSALRVEVRVANQQVFLQTAGTIATASDSLASGAYSVSLSPARR